MSGDDRVIRLRKRPKETSSKAKTPRVLFGREPIKELSIPAIANEYNYHMGVVNIFDHLTTQNPRLRPVWQGGAQAIEHWLLQTVPVNCYLLALCSDVPKPRQVSFRSQQDFRNLLIRSLLSISRDANRCPKRKISRISKGADQVPL